MEKFIFVYITNPSKKEAERITNCLLKKRLIVCGNIFPIDSLYWWKKKIAKEQEFFLIAKTIDKNFKEIKKEVEKMHPYSVPFIAKIPADINKKYFKWLEGEIQK